MTDAMGSTLYAKKCVGCGRSFTKNKREGHSQWNRRKYCGHACFYKNPTLGRPVSEETRLKISIANLGRKLSTDTRKKMSDRRKGKLLSPEVREKIRQSLLGKPTGRRSGGADSHFWRGGKTELRERFRGSAQYKEWRRKVFERDSYTCQHCGLHSGCGKAITLHADHYPIPMYGLLADVLRSVPEGADAFEYGLHYANLWDIENGRTLCKACHKNTDSWGKPSAAAYERFTRPLMSISQEKHLEHIIDGFSKRVDAKYFCGQREHQGDLWKMPPAELLENAICEAVDQVTYLLTLRDQLAGSRDK